MPIDPEHGKNIPTGRRLAIVVGRWLGEWGKRVANWLRSWLPIGGAAGAAAIPPVPPVIPPQLVEQVADIVTVEYSRGWRGVRVPKRRREEEQLPWEKPKPKPARLPRPEPLNLAPIEPQEPMIRVPKPLPLVPEPVAPVAAPVKPPPTPPIRPPLSSSFPRGPRVVQDWNIVNDEVRQAAREYSYNLIRNVTQTTIDKTREAIAAAIDAGETYKDAAKRLVSIYGPKRARVIAQTEVTRAMHAGQMHAAKSAGCWGKEWLASADACDKCKDLMAVGPIPIDSEFAVGIEHPPGHPNCVLGDTPVCGASILAAVRAVYRGKVIKLTFEDGSTVSVTENHMLLTRSGFAFAKDIVQGDDVIRTTAVPLRGTVFSQNPYVYWRPPLAQDVFVSLGKAFGVSSSTMPTSAEYLHGDAAAADAEIHVVNVDGFLRDGNDAGISQPAAHISFVPGGYAAGKFDTRSTLRKVFVCLLSATDSVVGSRRERLAFLRGHLGLPDVHGITPGTQLDAVLSKPIADSVAADAETLRQTQHALATLIGSDGGLNIKGHAINGHTAGNAELFETAANDDNASAKTFGDDVNGQSRLVQTLKVVGVDSFLATHGVPVYDFETDETLYSVGNGIISSNCRCAMLDLWTDPDATP